MPYAGGVYTLPPGTTATTLTAIDSSDYNAFVADIETAQNTARPIVAGGTGESTAIAAADAFSTKGNAIASAATCDIGAATGRFVHITGTTTITAFGTKTAGVIRYVTFDGALILTHNATSLILPGGANITTAANDSAIMVSEGSGNWRCLHYRPNAPVPNTLNGQYKFPATQNASADANTLDDYEEGTFTPTISFATPGDLSVAYTTQTATYTKIGRLVTVAFTIVTSSFTHTTASGNVQISTMPFAPAGTNFIGSMTFQGITKASYTQYSLRATAGSTTVTVAAAGSGQVGASVQASDMPTGGTVVLQGSVVFSV